MHGYGSNDSDLLGLGASLNPKLHIISLQAPISMGQGGFAWFELDWGEHGVIPNEPQALEARSIVVEFLSDLPQRFGVADGLLVAGFSQGAMMSLGVAFAAPKLVRGIVMMSGRILPAFVPEEEDRRLRSLRALVQHGTRDQVLPYMGSRDAAKLLTTYGATVDHREYPMAHEVSQESLLDIREWMAAG
jgi:phospholipase/carboxylesterase